MQEQAAPDAEMFPAPAGMSPDLTQIEAEHTHVPRTRGDEPNNGKGVSFQILCSPHPRG